jgi:predicted esterase
MNKKWVTLHGLGGDEKSMVALQSILSKEKHIIHGGLWEKWKQE